MSNTASEARSSKKQRFLDWLRGSAGALLGIPSAVLLAAWSAQGERVFQSPQLLLLIGGLVCLAAGVLASSLISPTYVELREQERTLTRNSTADREAVAATLQSMLLPIAELTGLNTDTARISVYVHHDGQFRAAGRYSRNPTLRRQGRAVFAEGQGVIGATWNGDDKTYRLLPADRDRWENRLVASHGFTREEARALSMQSRSIAGNRIEHAGRPVGVLIMESRLPKEVSASHRASVEASAITTALAEILHLHREQVVRAHSV